MEPLVSDDITLKETPVTVAGVSYTLREPTEDVARKYRNAIMRGVKVSEEGKAASFGDGGIADSESILVAACLYNGDGKPVPITVVRAWPSRVVKALFERAEEMGGLGRKREPDETKN